MKVTPHKQKTRRVLVEGQKSPAYYYNCDTRFGSKNKTRVSIRTADKKDELLHGKVRKQKARLEH